MTNCSKCKKLEAEIDSLKIEIEVLKLRLKCQVFLTEKARGEEGRPVVDGKCGKEFFRKDLNCQSTCGRDVGHAGEHSWYHDTPENKER